MKSNLKCSILKKIIFLSTCAHCSPSDIRQTTRHQACGTPWMMRTTATRFSVNLWSRKHKMKKEPVVYRRLNVQCNLLTLYGNLTWFHKLLGNCCGHSQNSKTAWNIPEHIRTQWLKVSYLYSLCTTFACWISVLWFAHCTLGLPVCEAITHCPWTKLHFSSSPLDKEWVSRYFCCFEYHVSLRVASFVSLFKCTPTWRMGDFDIKEQCTPRIKFTPENVLSKQQSAGI